MARVEKSSTDNYTATERLFLTADRERVVSADDPEAAFLLANEGTEIPAEEVERLGLAGRKAAAKTEDKQADTPANKSRSATAK